MFGAKARTRLNLVFGTGGAWLRLNGRGRPFPHRSRKGSGPKTYLWIFGGIRSMIWSWKRPIEDDMMIRPVLTFIVLVCSVALAQNVPASQSAKQSSPTQKKSAQESPTQHPWLERAQLLEAQLDQDMAQLSVPDAAIVDAQMSRSWWKLDPQRSRQLLDRAIELVTRAPQNEVKEDREARIKAGFQVISIATPMVGSEEARRIAAELSKGSEDPREKGMAAMQEWQALARAISIEASQGDPQRAAKMMLEAIDQGKGLLTSLGGLRFRDPELANRVFREALKALPSLNYDFRTVSILTMDAFPPSVAMKSPPEELQKALLAVAAEAVLHPPQNDDDKRNICNNVTRMMESMQGKFSPQKWAAIEAVSDSCMPKDRPKVERSSVDANTDCIKAGAQECVRLAEASKDVDTRGSLKENAIMAATQEQNPELAVAIYKGMSEEERRQDPTSYANALEPYDQLGQKYLKNHDRNSFFTMLREAPEEIQTRLHLMFADEMLEKESTPDGLSLLNEARASLAKHGSPDPDLYLQLLNTYARRLPGEAPAVMQECIEGLNRVEYPKSDTEAFRRRTSRMVRAWGLTPKLLDLDATFLAASAASLQVPQWRASFRMGLVHAALRRNQMESMEAKDGAASAK